MTCPWCGSENISGDHPQFILDLAEGPGVRLICEDCGYVWEPDE